MTQEWRQALASYIRDNANPPDKYSHQARLYRLATTLSDGKPFDDEVLYAAAWLHDLGVFIGHRPEAVAELAHWDHIKYATAKAPGVLQRCGFPLEKIEAVLEVIRTHMPSGVPTSFEGTLLCDADILEQLGAVGVLRTVSKVGRDNRFIRFSDALQVLRKNLSELPGQLRLEPARWEAASRVRILDDFLAAATAESGGLEW
ncbi:MAG: HD domain-containing protein [Limisphaerales bacterium]